MATLFSCTFFRKTAPAVRNIPIFFPLAVEKFPFVCVEAKLPSVENVRNVHVFPVFIC